MEKNWDIKEQIKTVQRHTSDCQHSVTRGIPHISHIIISFSSLSLDKNTPHFLSVFSVLRIVQNHPFLSMLCNDGNIFWAQVTDDQGSRHFTRMKESESVSRSVVSDSLWPPWTVAHQTPLCMKFSRQEYRSGLPFLLQGIYLTQGLNPSLQHCWQTFFTVLATRKVIILFNSKNNPARYILQLFHRCVTDIQCGSVIHIGPNS